MNKIKYLIATLIGAIVFVFATVFSVKAATLSELYDFDITQYVDDADSSVTKVLDGHSGTLTSSGTYDNSKSMKLKISAETVGSSGIYYSTSNKDLRVTKTDTPENLRFSFFFTSEGDSTISFKINTSGGGKYVEYWVDDATSATGTFSAGSLTEKSITISGAGNHTIYWHGTSTLSSDVKFSDINILDHYDADINTFDVTLNHDITDVSDTVTTVSENGKYILPDEDNSVLGSSFIGWKSSIDGITYSAGDEFTITQNITFTAQWKVNSLGSGKVFSVNNVQTGTYSSNVVMIDGTLYTTYANSSKSITVENATITGANGESFTKRMVLGGKSTLSGDNKSRLIEFIAPTDGVVKVQFVTGSNNKLRSAQIYESNNLTTAISSGSNSTSSTATEFSANVEKGNTYLVGSTTDTIVLLSVTFVQLSDDTTAAVAAYQNTTKDSLMFVGTLTGISDIANIDTIELVLTKDGDAANSNLSLTTCYVSVSYTKSDSTIDTTTYAAATNTYYVIGKITGINSTIFTDGTAITCQLVVTFTDSSTTTSETISFTWNN